MFDVARGVGVTEAVKQYRIVCISLYHKDIIELDAKVKELKRRGHRKANKSQLIRAALAQVNLDTIAKV